MKNLIICILLCALAAGLTADAKSEAMSSLDTAKGLVNSGDYKKASEEITYALSKVNEILAGMLVKYLPDAPAGYNVDSREALNLGAAGAWVGSANSLAAEGNYSAESGSSLKVTISVGGLLGQTAGFAAMGQMWGGAGTGSTSVRVKGYTGTLEFDQESRSGTLSIKVGDDTSVSVEGYDIASGDVLKALAEKIDMSNLEKEF